VQRPDQRRGRADAGDDDLHPVPGQDLEVLDGPWPANDQVGRIGRYGFGAAGRGLFDGESHSSSSATLRALAVGNAPMTPAAQARDHQLRAGYVQHRGSDHREPQAGVRCAGSRPATSSNPLPR